MVPDDATYPDATFGTFSQLITAMAHDGDAPKALVRGGSGTGKTALLRRLVDSLGPGHRAIWVGGLPKKAAFADVYGSVVGQVFPSFVECLAAGPPVSSLRSEILGIYNVRLALGNLQAELARPDPDPRELDFYRDWISGGRVQLRACFRRGLSSKFNRESPSLSVQMLRALSGYFREVCGVGYTVVLDELPRAADHGVQEGLRSLADPTNVEVGLLVSLSSSFPLRNDVLQRFQGMTVTL